MVKVRFAPSPTGYVHIGNMRAALFNWLLALKSKGTFILRFDDTDLERSKQEYVDAILEDIHWLGIIPAQVEFQSKRFALYDAAVEKLKAEGLLYPCYETPEELERRRKIRLSRKLPPVYGREALKLTEAEKQAYEAEGRRPHWRFLLPNFTSDPHKPERRMVEWVDLVRGAQMVDMASLSDPVLVRADGTYLYTLPSVIDDIDMGITHIIRGDDHLTNTGAQIPIFQALGGEIPQFGHLNLLTTDSGEGLSKRKGNLSIRSLREVGYEPMSIASLAVLIGTSQNVIAYENMAQLSEAVDIVNTSRSSAQFNAEDLPNLNRQLVHNMPFEQAKERLQTYGLVGERAQEFWLAVRENLNFVANAKDWIAVIDGDILVERGDFSTEERTLLQQALDLLPPEPWTNETWKIWTKSVQEKTAIKGRALFMPLRRAITGAEHGPNLSDLLPLIGSSRLCNRLKIAIS